MGNPETLATLDTRRRMKLKKEE